MSAPAIEYRPNIWLGLFLAAVNFIAVAAFIWIALNLGPAAVAAMDGFNRILFTVIPISLFSSLGAVCFFLIGVLITRRSLRPDPTLVISDACLRLPSGEDVLWAAVESVEHKQSQLGGDRLVIAVEHEEMENPASERGLEISGKRFWQKWWSRNRLQSKWEISSFELGAEPESVLLEIDRRRVGLPPLTER